MGKTLAVLRSELKSLVDASDLPNSWADAWLNEALADLTPVLRLETKTTIAVSQGVDEYGEPANAYEVKVVRLGSEDGTRLLLPVADFGNTGYKMWAGKIILQPMPQEADTMYVWYWRTPASLSVDGDVPEVPDYFQHLLVWYAACVYQTYDKNASIESASYWPKYAAGKMALNRYTARRAERFLPRRWKVEV